MKRRDGRIDGVSRLCQKSYISLGTKRADYEYLHVGNLSSSGVNPHCTESASVLEDNGETISDLTFATCTLLLAINTLISPGPPIGRALPDTSSPYIEKNNSKTNLCVITIGLDTL